AGVCVDPQLDDGVVPRLQCQDRVLDVDAGLLLELGPALDEDSGIELRERHGALEEDTVGGVRGVLPLLRPAGALFALEVDGRAERLAPGGALLLNRQRSGRVRRLVRGFIGESAVI